MSNEKTTLIKTTNLLMGKGVKLSEAKDNGWYIWEVTEVALSKIKVKHIRFEYVN